MQSKFLILTAVSILFSVNVFGQTGGDYAITQSVIASGGGQSANGGAAIEGSLGQTLAGRAMSGNPFAVTNGFWNFTPLAPTAATASISGRILSAESGGVRNVIISLSGLSGGRARTARSTTFGFYQFENVPVGETYILTVRSNRFVFLPDTRIVTLLDDLTGMDFTAQPEN